MFLPDTTGWAYPVIWEVFKGGAWGCRSLDRFQQLFTLTLYSENNLEPIFEGRVSKGNLFFLLDFRIFDTSIIFNRTIHK